MRQSMRSPGSGAGRPALCISQATRLDLCHELCFTGNTATVDAREWRLVESAATRPSRSAGWWFLAVVAAFQLRGCDMGFGVRGRRWPQGAKPLSAERAEYFRLVQQGFSSAEACRRVGVSETTGRRWRNGSSGSPGHATLRPVKVSSVPPSGPSRYLTEDERIHIADRRREKAGIRQIAAELGRSPSTISREVRRNANPDSGAYRPWAAQRRAEAAGHV